MPDTESLRHAISRVLNSSNSLSDKQSKLLTKLALEIGHTSVEGVEISINRSPVPPVVFFGFVWKAGTSEQTTHGNSTHLGRAVGYLRRGINIFQFSNPTFASNPEELSCLIQQKNNPLKGVAVTELKGNVERKYRTNIEVNFKSTLEDQS